MSSQRVKLLLGCSSSPSVLACAVRLFSAEVPFRIERTATTLCMTSLMMLSLGLYAPVPPRAWDSLMDTPKAAAALLHQQEEACSSERCVARRRLHCYSGQFMAPLTISCHCVQLDAGVVKFGEKVPFPTPIHGSADMSRGTHFLLWDSESFHPSVRGPVERLDQ